VYRTRQRAQVCGEWWQHFTRTRTPEAGWHLRPHTPTAEPYLRVPDGAARALARRGAGVRCRHELYDELYNDLYNELYNDLYDECIMCFTPVRAPARSRRALQA
jgi:hypothetical protein